ncbi:hypothetical protein [Bacillus cereus]|uniref:hypothetical protein n=1 Tax=Bacillus cereus TaxID=1396 RepID=UPI0024BCB3A7|nr:hypothetical protein [Bacillus cereus]
MKIEEIKDEHMEMIADLISEKVLNKIDDYFNEKNNIGRIDVSLPNKKYNFSEEYEIEEIFFDDNYLWQEKDKGYHLTLQRNESVKNFLSDMINNTETIDDQEYKKFIKAIAKDAHAMLLMEVYNNIFRYLEGTENVNEQLEQEFFWIGKDGLNKLYNMLQMLDYTQAKDIEDKISEELNFDWKIPKVLLPLYTYTYLFMPIDNRILNVHKQPLNKLNLALRFIDEYPTKKSKDLLLKMRSKVEDFYSILNAEGIADFNKSLNLIYFNNMTHLYNVELFTKQILEKDKLAPLYKSYDEKMGKSKKFDYIKNISWLYYSRSGKFLNGTQCKILNNDLRKGFIHLDEIDDEKFEDFKRFLKLISQKLKSCILKNKKVEKGFELPKEIEDDYYVYSKLVKIEFYEKFINKINPEKLKALKSNGTKKEKSFFYGYHTVYSTIYEYKKQENS